MNEHERGLVKSFIAPEKQERVDELLTSERGRAKFRAALGHFSDWQPAVIVPVQKGQDDAASLAQWLRVQGAPASCYLVSENKAWDGIELPLDEALEKVVGSDFGTFVSCVPGKLAYFEDEDGRHFLKSR